MNTYIQSPEIVFIGVAGHKKTTVIEAFLGHKIIDSKNWKTKRPIHFRIISNVNCEKPIITIKRDITSKTFNSDIKVELKDLPTELSKRNSVSDVPIVVHYEYKECWNLTLVDTPDLPEDSVAKKIEDLDTSNLDLSRAPNRILVAVENTCDWGKSHLLDLMKSIDMKLDRTLFVYTNFASHIKNFSEAKDANQFFASTLQGNNEEAYFITLPEDNTLTDIEKYSQEILAYEKADIESLEQLKFNRRYVNQIGVYYFKKHLYDMTWKIYQDNIPSIQNRLRALKSNSEHSLEAIKTRLEGLEPNKLRSAASNFVMNFLASIEKLLVGTLEGNPAQNGLTLAEEKEISGDWIDDNGEIIKLKSTKNIPYADTRIYGGQEFERLLAEFKVIVNGINLKEVTIDEIATSSGSHKLNNLSSLTWVTCDLVRIEINRLFSPLLNQLMQRATFIMKRLSDIALKMMMSTYKKNKSRQTSTQLRSNTLRSNAQNIEFDFSPEEFPYYSHFVKELYHDIVDRIAEECMEKCLDEFYCTQLIFWETTKSKDEKKKDKDVTNPKDVVNKLAQDIFTHIKSRLTRNLLLKCHNYFLVPMQSPLWGELQSNISTLSDEKLEELFELSTTKQRLKDDEKNLQQILEKFGSQEESFQTASHEFSHPIRT